jgi:signal transduction histidine kinase
VASLFVIEGADQGRRFELPPGTVALGRDSTNTVRLHDSEVSRRHAEVRPADDNAHRLVDTGSANGTYLNGQLVDQALLHSGDQIRLGRTLLLYTGSPADTRRDLTERVDLLSRASPADRSAILRSIPVSDGSHVLEAPARAGEWLKVRLANLSVMYQATQAVSHISDLDELMPRILQLVFESIGADRAAILLEDEAGKLTPKAVRWLGEAEPEERMAISQTIIDHVREQGQGVISTDAPADGRFSPSQSIVDYGIREAICVPIQGRHTTLGVIYADVRAGNDFITDPDSGRVRPRGRFTNEHLMLMVALGQHAGLAIENTRFYQAKLQAERLAAVGQTIATLSHHIKNILQGLRGGSYLIDLGLKDRDEEVIRRGWSILEKNQSKIYNLVMDMLSFSKEREPALEPTDLNETVADVVELMQTRATELGATLAWNPGLDLPEVWIDPDGIHRAALNIITNAIDATERDEGSGEVTVSTRWDPETQTAQILVEDNGPGIPEEEIPSIFQIFASSKGTRGTGLGLPVSRKIIREHGGEILVTSEVGRGSCFTIELPQRRPEIRNASELESTSLD